MRSSTAPHPSLASLAAALPLLLSLGCKPVVSEAPPEPEAPVASPRDQSLLEQLASHAEANPQDFDALKAAGMAHMWATLAGDLQHRDRAEHWLEAAFEHNATDVELNRSLGRFYNLRGVAGNDDKAEWQVRAYRALLGDDFDTPPTRPAMFVAWSFMKLGEVLTARKRGNLFAALATVKQLEAELATRTQEHPNDIEMFALAGNFSFFFAGNIPTDKKRRVQEAVTYFEVVRDRWQEMRAGARNTEHCPNTYENFMFELAEGYTVLGQLDDARPLYEQLGQATTDDTLPRQQIALVSQERLQNLEAYSGSMALMPPWPSDEANCVVCHSYRQTISTKSLHTLQPLDFSGLTTTAQQPPAVLRP